MPELGNEQQQHIKRLHSKIQQKNPDGSYRFADDQVADLLALLLLGTMSASKAPLNQAEEASLVDFALRAGLSGEESPQQLQQTITTYFTAHPWDPELALAVQDMVKLLLGQSGGKTAEAFYRFLGSGQKLQPLQQKKRPAGTIPAGPAARFQLQVKK